MNDICRKMKRQGNNGLMFHLLTLPTIIGIRFHTYKQRVHTTGNIKNNLSQRMNLSNVSNLRNFYQQCNLGTAKLR